MRVLIRAIIMKVNEQISKAQNTSRDRRGRLVTESRVESQAAQARLAGHRP